MDALNRWYTYLESSQFTQDLTQWMFEYLPEELCAQMPHHIATYLIVAAICLVISVVIGLYRRADVIKVLACVVCTAVCVAFSLAISKFSFFDPLHSVQESLDGLRIAFHVMGADLLSLDILGVLLAILNALTWVISLIFWGILTILPFPPILFALMLECDTYGFLGGVVSFVGHSAIALAVIIAVKVVYSLALPLLLQLFILGFILALCYGFIRVTIIYK